MEARADPIEARVRAEGLLAEGRRVVVLLSGGRDSVCLLDLAVRIAGPDAVRALHAEYGLREGAAGDEAHCATLCADLGVPLTVVRPRRPAGGGGGNVQAWAREARYAAAGELARRHDADVATGHTASDQAEGVLYRLAASPGRRALLGMPAREGRLVRPLLGLTRAQNTAWCEARGLAWREDPTNAGDAYARSRVRHGLLDALRAVHPGAEGNVLRTLALLRDEAAVLDAAVDAALADAGDPPEVARLAALPPALARLALQRLADAVRPGVAVGPHAAAVLAAREGTASLDLGGGLRAVVEYGRLRIAAAPPPAPPAPALLPVPGRVAFGAGELVAEQGARLPLGEGVLDRAALAPPLEVRPWRAGDRMRPLGLGGSRSLQDLFTDRKVPRERRRALPVVVSAGTIAWVPGVATDERLRVTPATAARVRLTWHDAP